MIHLFIHLFQVVKLFLKLCDVIERHGLLFRFGKWVFRDFERVLLRNNNQQSNVPRNNVKDVKLGPVYYHLYFKFNNYVISSKNI